MPERPLNPRDNPKAKLLRQSEPYAFQRKRSAIHSNYPRAAQPNTSQPNQLPAVQGWGMGGDYWGGVFQDYLRRRNNIGGMK